MTREAWPQLLWLWHFQPNLAKNCHAQHECIAYLMCEKPKMHKSNFWGLYSAHLNPLAGGEGSVPPRSPPPLSAQALAIQSLLERAPNLAVNAQRIYHFNHWQARRKLQNI